MNVTGRITRAFLVGSLLAAMVSVGATGCALGQFGLINTESPATGPAGVAGSGGTGAAGSFGSGGTMGGTSMEASRETAGEGAGTTVEGAGTLGPASGPTASNR